MLFKIADAKSYISNALNKFKAKQLNHWSSNGSSFYKYELPSGTQLLLITTPAFDGESIEIEWKWVLN